MTLNDDSLEGLNRSTYRNRAIVAQYQRRSDILPGEQLLFRTYRERLSGSRLLDIGVGGGRTTAFLLDMVQHYTGVDLSDEMVDACKLRFPDQAGSFRQCDVRDMSMFGDQSFDIVLFSFNGLDYIPHQGRLAALREIRRVVRPGGLFIFSTHLTPSLKSRFASTANPNSDNWLSDWRLRLLFHWHNLGVRNIDAAPYSLVRDASHNFRLITYYSQPETVLEQLADAGFGAVRIFENYREAEMSREAFLTTLLNWAYFAVEA
ncbi:MAG: methyltransferase domain-containing protein [Rhodospirillales bacterium]